MLSRIVRLIRGFFGLWIDTMEDPVLILKQNIRDLNDQVPRMNEHIAMVRANVTLLENENCKIENKVKNLNKKIRAALHADRRDIALNYATTLEEVQNAKGHNVQQLKIGRSAYEHALKVKKAFMMEKEKKTKEAMQAIRDAERAKWQKEIADTFETFEVAGINQTHDDMVAKAEEQAAKDRAHLELALQSVDDHEFEIEEEVKRLEANDIVRQFEQEIQSDNLDDTQELKSAGKDLATE